MAESGKKCVRVAAQEAILLRISCDGLLTIQQSLAVTCGSFGRTASISYSVQFPYGS